MRVVHRDCLPMYAEGGAARDGDTFHCLPCSEAIVRSGYICISPRSINENILNIPVYLVCNVTSNVRIFSSQTAGQKVVGVKGKWRLGCARFRWPARVVCFNLYYLA